MPAPLDVHILDTEGRWTVLKGEFNNLIQGDYVTTSSLPGCRVWPLVHWGCYLIGAIHCRPGFNVTAMIGEQVEPG